MGNGTYDFNARTVRSQHLGYHTNSFEEVFTQQKERRIHESMDPKGVAIRECRDSEDHPEAFPIILSLDVTASMGKIPHMLVKDGLPTLMSNILERGVDVAILFCANGDSKCDQYPFQVGQFESSDELLDTWLTRTYIEGGGGGNGGESYSLPWYFANYHVVSDAWEKRGQKALIISIGDESVHRVFGKSSIYEVMGDTANAESPTDAKKLLKLTQEKFNIYHIHCLDGCHGDRPMDSWKEILGENVIACPSYEKIPEIITEIVLNNAPTKKKAAAKTNKPEKVEENIL